MQQLAPWSTPDTYCQAVNSWTVTVSTPNPLCQGLFPPTGCGSSIPKFWTDTYAVWSSDHVFCLSGTTELWLLFLFLAGALWVLLTVLKLFHTFDWRGLAGFRVSDIVKAIGGQAALIIVAVCSFALLLQVHQFNFLVINSLVGSLPDQRVDSLWAKLDTLLSASQTATQNLDPNAWATSLFGGNLPDNSAPFGLTWGQIFGGLGSLESFLLSTLLPVRFAALFIAVVSAPLAIMASSLPYTRRFFWIWLEFWLEIEALAAGSALVLAAYQQLHHPLETSTTGGLAPTEQAIILLAFAGLICGANLTFLWKIIGSFLSNITSFYQQQYQRERQFWGILAQAAVGIAGAVATVMTGGAALPAVLAVEAGVSGLEELGAVPASPVPGSGVGHGLLSAGGAAAWRAGASTGTPASGSPRSSGPGGPTGAGTGSPAAPTAGTGAPGATAGGNLPPGPAPAPAGLPGAHGGPALAGPTPVFGGNVPPVPSTGVPGGVPASPTVPLGTTGPTQTVHPSSRTSAGARGPGGGPSALVPPNQPAPMPPAPTSPPARVAPGGGSGAFSGLRFSPLWSAQPTGQPASLQAIQALPAVLSQMPLRPEVQQSLLAPWHTARGEEIAAKAVFHSYFRHLAFPEAPLDYSWRGTTFLRVSTTAGQVTGVPLEAIERRLQAAPYLADTVELYQRGWIRAEEVTPVADALGTLYHAQPRRSYLSNAEQVRDFLVGTASAHASNPDHGAAALLQFIGGLTPPRGGKQP